MVDMYFVYILKSVNHTKSYVGITDDLERRLNQHNSGYHLFTKRYMPWNIIYTEKYPSRIEARQREIYLKTTSGRRWLKKNIFTVISAGVAKW